MLRDSFDSVFSLSERVEVDDVYIGDTYHHIISPVKVKNVKGRVMSRQKTTYVRFKV